MMRRPVCLALLLAALVFPGGAGAADSFLIRGAGYGHGVGLSQYGAYGYALHGKGYATILRHYYRGTTLGREARGTTVRVLLKTGTAAFSGATRAGRKRLRASATYVVQALADGTLKLTGPDGKQVARFAAPLEVTGPGPLHVAGLGAYRGALEFRPDGTGGVQTVDAVALEDYVRGVIAAEMPSSWPAQALEAQAVAARTYAITTSVAGNGFTLYPDTRSQMYGGVGAETPATDAAVAATRRQVATYNGVPVATYFFSSSGGHSEDNENVWPGGTPDPWLRGVSDPYDGAGGDPYHRWRSDMTLAAASHRLGRLVKGRLVGIRVLRHGVSPRIITAAIVGTRGSTRVSGSDLERLFGLRSTWASFTTIETRASRSSARGTRVPRSASWSPAGLAGAALLASAPAFSRVTAQRGAVAVRGFVYPARRGDTVLVQSAGRGGWRTVARARLGAGGTYSLRVTRPGRYRVVYRGVDGPVLAV